MENKEQERKIALQSQANELEKFLLSDSVNISGFQAGIGDDEDLEILDNFYLEEMLLNNGREQWAKYPDSYRKLLELLKSRGLF